MGGSRWKTLTAESLKEMLSWPNVREEFDGFLRISVLPTNPNLPPIYFLLAGDRESLQAVGFGKWHYHPTSPEDEPEEEEREDPLDAFDRAIQLVRSLVQRKSCIIYQLDEADKTVCSGPCETNDVPDRVDRRTVLFQRVFFDQEPVAEEIDFTRYTSDGHGGCITPKLKAELERLDEAIRLLSREDLTDDQRERLYNELMSREDSEKPPLK